MAKSDDTACDTAGAANGFTLLYPYYNWMVTKLKEADAGSLAGTAFW
jgi:hypothetical protein